ncbi:MAG: GrpB family protein [Eubacteriales bacterium]
MLSEYNPALPEWYAEEKINLERLIGTESIARMSHFGSTSVPGLMAKPTIDILLEIKDDANVKKLMDALSSPEYICLNPPYIPTSPPHLMFLKGYLLDGFAEKVYHIHVRYFGDWDELYFRDYCWLSRYVGVNYRYIHGSRTHDKNSSNKIRRDFSGKEKAINAMNLSKSIDFLLENAGAVIKYRLKKEILRDINLTEEENLLDQIYQTPNFKLVQSYVKPNGYIGSGAHSWGKWRGVIYQPTYLADGEASARLLSNYAVPKNHPIIVNFVNAMRDEETLREVFSYIPPEIPRFKNRYVGLKSGGSLMITIYAMQALLGHGDDDYVKSFCDISLDAFCSLLPLISLDDITKPHKTKGFQYIEADTYFPCSYHLTSLAHTRSWRTPENVKTISNALNHLNKIMKNDNSVAVKVGNEYYGPGWAFGRPFKPFKIDTVDTVMYRRPLTEIAMLGVGESVEVIRESAANVREAIDMDGILKTKFKKTSFSPYPTAYVDVRLETDHKRKYALECDLTFWAVQFLTLVEGAKI